MLECASEVFGSGVCVSLAMLLLLFIGSFSVGKRF